MCYCKQILGYEISAHIKFEIFKYSNKYMPHSTYILCNIHIHNSIVERGIEKKFILRKSIIMRCVRKRNIKYVHIRMKEWLLKIKITV